jgi:hypothetical protein
MFDPSRGVNGYSPEEYRQLLSRYMGGRVRFSTSAQNYLVLAQQALVAAQRWAGLPFTESFNFPRLAEPLPYYRHYVPGQEYSRAELDAHYRHYGVSTVADLLRVHLQFEEFYGLDPSFLLLARDFRARAISAPSVLKQLLYLFNEPTASALFRNRYQLHSMLNSDIDVSGLLLHPERYLTRQVASPIPQAIVSVSSPPVRSPSQYLRERSQRALQELLSTWSLTPDGAPITTIIQQTAAASSQRYQALSAFSTYALEQYVRRHGIPTAYGSDERVDLLRTLARLGSPEQLPSLALDYERLDPTSSEPYNSDELQELVAMYGLAPSTPIDMSNNLYLLTWLPNFFRPGAEATCPTVTGRAISEVPVDQRYAYGIPGQEYLCYTRDELLAAFQEQRRLADPLEPRVSFPDYAAAYLEYLAREDALLRRVVAELRSQGPSTSLLTELPLVPVEVYGRLKRKTTYLELARGVFRALYQLAQYLRGWCGPGAPYPPENMAPCALPFEVVQLRLAEFYQTCEGLPSVLANAVLSLPSHVGRESIADLYDLLWNGKTTPQVISQVLITAENYLK